MVGGILTKAISIHKIVAPNINSHIDSISPIVSNKNSELAEATTEKYGIAGAKLQISRTFNLTSNLGQQSAVNSQEERRYYQSKNSGKPMKMAFIHVLLDQKPLALSLKTFFQKHF
ncbi:MAG: hypothetical protein JSW60_03460 [Thermoplasmatales archaeon]|nr:MAG: hypothetical protein JSW60_03460 [Thermoplasmatales archaeon]